MVEWDVSDPAHPAWPQVEYIDGPEEGMVLDHGRLIVSGEFLVEMNPDDLWPYSAVGIHPFGRAIAVGDELAYTFDGTGFSLFARGPLQYAGSGFVAAPAPPGGIAEVSGHVYVTDAQGIHIFHPACRLQAGVGLEGIAREAAGLAPASPDPFVGRTDLRFRLTAPSAVGLFVFDPGGRRVRTLADGRFLGAGAHTLTWDGRDDLGRQTPAGVYFVRLGAAGREFTGRIVRVR